MDKTSKFVVVKGLGTASKPTIHCNRSGSVAFFHWGKAARRRASMLGTGWEAIRFGRMFKKG